MINIATDGACKGNPGIGGWGVAIFEGEDYIHGIRGGLGATTNNRMELTACIQACYYIADNPSEVTLWIDSTYVLKGCTEWLPGWISKNYRGVKNEDLWKEVAELRDIWQYANFKWVKGHSGNLFNDKADDLANEGCTL